MKKVEQKVSDIGQNMTPELLDKLLVLEKKLENPELLRFQVESLESSMRMTKDGFDMLDRTLSMTELLHSSETKKIDIFLDIIKYLMPIFATSLITGMAVNATNIKSQLLVWIGFIGFIALSVVLTILFIRRKKILEQQTKNYEKLNEVYSDWRKLSDLQKNISIPNLDELNADIRPLMEGFFGLQDKYKKDKI